MSSLNYSTTYNDQQIDPPWILFLHTATVLRYTPGVQDTQGFQLRNFTNVGTFKCRMQRHSSSQAIINDAQRNEYSGKCYFEPYADIQEADEFTINGDQGNLNQNPPTYIVTGILNRDLGNCQLEVGWRYVL